MALPRVLSDLRGTRSSAFTVQPAALAGPPTGGSYRVGDWYQDANGDLFKCILAGVPGNWVPAGPCVMAQAKNLVIATTSTTALTITADTIIVTSGGGGSRNVGPGSVTLDITTVGVGGLDAGTLAASTWYCIWVVASGTGGVALASLSSTAPTLPAGYAYGALVGAVRTTAAKTITPFYQLGTEVALTPVVILNAAAGATTYTALSLAAAVPASAKTCWGNMGASVNVASVMAVASDATGLGEHLAYLPATPGVTPWGPTAPFKTVLKTSQTLYWKATTAATWRLEVTGFTL